MIQCVYYMLITAYSNLVYHDAGPFNPDLPEAPEDERRRKV